MSEQTQMYDGPEFDELPAGVAARVVELVADVLPQMSDLPPAVRSVAGFAPAKRARSGRSTIARALRDDDFRRRAGLAARGESAPAWADPPGEVAPTPVPAGVPPVEVAAWGWLLGAEGGDGLLDQALGEVDADRRAEENAREEAASTRLRQQLDVVQGELREQRARHRTELDELKAENSGLRRKLGDARAQLRAHQEQDPADAAPAPQVQQGRAGPAADGPAEGDRPDPEEVRRLRARVTELEAQLANLRRETRGGREQATVRARLLLETLADAANGLRRELALPPSTATPADWVEADLAEEPAGRPAGRTRRPAALTPQLLDQYLSMPRARLIVDGYNVSKNAWPQASLEAQRTRLLGALAGVVARSGAETTVVFDAAGAASRPLVSAPRGVKVLFSPPGVIADDVIRDLLAAEPAGRTVLVVTSDAELAGSAVRAGARDVPSELLIEMISR